MLQAVVAENDIDLGVRSQQGAACRHPIAPDPDRHTAAPSEQHRLVADFGRGRIRCYRARCEMGTAVTAADDSRPPAAILQLPGQPQRQRRLAGAADRDVADDDDRHWKSLRFRLAAPVICDCRIEAGQRHQKPQRRRKPALFEPLTLQPAGNHQCGAWVANEICGKPAA